MLRVPLKRCQRFHNFLVNKLCEKGLTSKIFKPFHASIPTLYPLKTPEHLWFSGALGGYKIGILT